MLRGGKVYVIEPSRAVDDEGHAGIGQGMENGAPRSSFTKVQTTAASPARLAVSIVSRGSRNTNSCPTASLARDRDSSSESLG